MVVAVGDPALTREILIDPLSTKPKEIYGAFNLVTNAVPNMFTEAGDIPWKHARKGVAPAFSSQHVRRMNRICMEHTEKFIKERLEPLIDAGESFDVAEEMINLTISVICESAFEFEPTKDETNMFLEELTIALREFSFKTALNPLRQIFGWFLPEVRRARIAADRLQQFALKILKSYREGDNHALEDTVIGRIVNNANYKDDLARAADITMFLVAGHDTTGFSIAWILLELARNPNELTKLRAETLKVPEEERTKTNALKNVIRETSRLNPVAAMGSVRQIGRDMYTELKPRLFLPKGSIIFLPQIVQNRNKLVFEEPNKFLPSRWENASEVAMLGANPFSLGPRNCVGQRLANAELHSVVARLCAEFDFTVQDEGTSDYFLTLKPAGARLMAHRVNP
jgi:cytochrome P450